MDSFTRKYLYFLGSLFLIGIVWWLSSLDFRAGDINKVLEADMEIVAYPYPFRVLSVEKGIAKISSPRSANFSAVQSLRIMFPELKNSSATSDEMVSSQKELARIQSHAGKLVKSQKDINSIRWVLDQQWLLENGAQIY
jgi:hypothetical protein